MEGIALCPADSAGLCSLLWQYTQQPNLRQEDWFKWLLLAALSVAVTWPYSGSASTQPSGQSTCDQKSPCEVIHALISGLPSQKGFPSLGLAVGANFLLPRPKPPLGAELSRLWSVCPLGVCLGASLITSVGLLPSSSEASRPGSGHLGSLQTVLSSPRVERPRLQFSVKLASYSLLYIHSFAHLTVIDFSNF